jgi:lipopolysaccharide cholinephosphotransferase
MDEIVNDFTIKFKRFNEFQIKAVETLFFFHNVCEKYEIPYYLAYGSLLGAIRDGGQIPWDYDVDVQVPVKYADKLIEVLQIECADKYHN